MTSQMEKHEMNARNGNGGRIAGGIVFAALAILFVTGCTQKTGAEAKSQQDAAVGVAHGSNQALAETAQCTGANAHETHLRSFACSVCHSTNGGAYAFDVPYTFPGGTTTAGGTVTKGSGNVATTCTVACHYPKGQPSKSVAWNASAPLNCTACHATTSLPGTHPTVPGNSTRDTCTACHVVTNHTNGTVAIVSHPAGWTVTTDPNFHAFSANQGLANCQACHGATLDGLGSAPACANCHNTSLPNGVASWKVNCVMCHGGTDNQTGAPAKTTWGNSADAKRVGAHTSHVTAGTLAPAFDCSACHVKPADVFSNGHIDSSATADMTFGGLAIANSSSPVWNRTNATCANTYCHGNFTNGNAATPIWTGGSSQGACGTCHGTPPAGTHPTVVGGLTACVTCHPDTMNANGTVIPPASGGKHLDGTIQASGGGHGTGWLDTASANFHAYSANNNLASCKGCHGANLDGVGGSATTSCATCHGATWKTSCTMCHGGTDNLTGAPPKGTWGYRTDTARIGAHTKHLRAGAFAGATACVVCHVVPAAADSANHMNGPTATVTFSGVAGASNANPSWNRGTGTCANTYCHGGYTGTFVYDFWGPMEMTYAGKNASPTWTGAAMTCTSCHDGPPKNGVWHSGAHSTANACNVCHNDVNAAGTAITNTARHINGTVDVTPVWKSACFNCH